MHRRLRGSYQCRTVDSVAHNRKKNRKRLRESPWAFLRLLDRRPCESKIKKQEPYEKLKQTFLQPEVPPKATKRPTTQCKTRTPLNTKTKQEAKATENDRKM